MWQEKVDAMAEVTAPPRIALTAPKVTGWLAAILAVAMAVVGLASSVDGQVRMAASDPPRIVAVERPLSADALVGVLPAPAPRGRTHEVGPGDTLSGIAAAAGVPVAVLIEANALDAPDRLALGQVLEIPAAVTSAAP